jgi:hypothetical protein
MVFWYFVTVASLVFLFKMVAACGIICPVAFWNFRKKTEMF